MPVQWRKSTHSSGVEDEHCVELGRLASRAEVAVRDSRDPDGDRLVLSVDEFASLLGVVKRRAGGC